MVEPAEEMGAEPPVECGQCGGVGTTFIDGNHFRFAVVSNGLAKETQGGGGIPFGGQQEVDGLACSIDRSV
ncbi:Uncharacterised protein [Yersinia pekkanenii]|uniref:Uncharacterized protein n=1 Tax=Yersinia pekkanenii TaxID=1288385 RepID=A0ABP1ZXT1_9GAMM|nr:Uncharacterised protein [Yersinia pekkanenii]